MKTISGRVLPTMVSTFSKKRYAAKPASHTMMLHMSTALLALSFLRMKSLQSEWQSSGKYRTDEVKEFCDVIHRINNCGDYTYYCYCNGNIFSFEFENIDSLEIPAE